MVYHATLGDLDEARSCERRAQLLLLQDGARAPATDLHAEAAARFLCDDLDGLRQMLDRLREASERYPARAVMWQLAECHCLRLKGDPGSALEKLLPLLQTASPEKSVRFAWIGATHLMLLNALGRHAEAAASGRRYLAASFERGLELGDCSSIVRPLAEALAHTDSAADAIALSEQLIAHFQGLGASGLILGSCYENRARIALVSRDGLAFELWSRRCRTEYERVRNPALGAKLARLMRDAQLAHVASSVNMSEPAANPADHDEPSTAEGTAISRMTECVDARERARCALELLLEQTDAGEGHLYGWLAGRLTHLASVPDLPPPEGLDDALQGYVEGELRASDTTAPGGSEPQAPPDGTADQLWHGLRPTLLSTRRDGEPLVAAVAVLGRFADRSRRPSAELLSALAQSLLEHDDVDALARLV
jgi:hypothetical protein